MNQSQQQARIANILATHQDDLKLTIQNAKTYFHYLKNNIVYPCSLIPFQRFPWEEPFAFGYGSDDQFEETRKHEPSCYDVFQLIKLLEPEDEPIIAVVRRDSDKKIFEIHLHWLIEENPDSPNAQMFEDYSFWHVNY